MRLGRIRDGRLQHEAGTDVTFSAPKSVSLAALVDGDKRVVRAHDEAVRAALDWIETELLVTRQWDRATRRRERVSSPNMVAAVFRHLANRNLDPQLHSHAVIANMTRSPDGLWRSLDLGSLHRNRMLIGAYYRNELAARLTALGYDLEPSLAGRVPSFEVRGYGRRVLRSFSTRRQEVEAWIRKRGVANTASRRRQAALATRARKNEPDRAAMTAMWTERAREMGLPSRKARAMRRRRRRIHETAVDGTALSAHEVVWRSMEHLEERQSVFAERALDTLALGHSPGRFRLPELKAAARDLLRDGHLVAAKRRDPAFATARSLKAEKDIVARMRAGLGAGAPLAAEESVAAALAASRLTRGQRDAVRRMLCGRDRIVGVQGYAGTGKTAMLREAARLAGAGRIVGLAPTSVAARTMAREAGIAVRTLQWFLTRYRDAGDGMVGDRALERMRAGFAGTVLVLDEASMVGTAAMRDLMRIAERLGVERIALVGDAAQLRAVDAGSPFRLLQRAGMPTAAMDEIMRQRDPDLKAAVEAVLDAEPALAIERLGEDVREVAFDALGETAARIWLQLDDAARNETVLLAPTHELRERINAAVREGLETEGVLHGRSIAIERLVSRGMTRAQKGDIRNYAEGDEVVFLHEVQGGRARAGECFVIAGVDERRARLEHEDGRRLTILPEGQVRYQVEVYETRRIELRAGDRIRWTRNDAARGLANGDRAAVTAIGPRKVGFRTEDGRTLELSRKDLQLRHLDHAWSSTVHGAQGMTRDTVIAVLDSGHGALTDQATFYVELSRARDRAVVLTDNREELMEVLEASTGEQLSALEAVGEDPARTAHIADREELWPQLSAWRAHASRAAAAGMLPLDREGHDEAVARLRRLAARRDLPCAPPAAVARILDEQDRQAAVRAEVEAWRGDAGAGAAQRRQLAEAAAAAGLALTEMPGWRDWRQRAARRAEAGRKLLDGREYRPHIDRAQDIRAAVEGEVGELEAAVVLGDACAGLLDDWQAHGEAARAAGGHPFHMEGYDGLVARLEDMARKQDLPDAVSARFTRMLDGHRALVRAGDRVAAALPAFRAAGEGRMQLLAEAKAVDLPVTGLAAWKDWKEEAGALARLGKTLLEGDASGVHLDRDPGDRALVEEAVAANAALLEAGNRLAGALDGWRAHAARAAADGLSPLDADGADEAVEPLRDLAAQTGLPVALPQAVRGILDEHARDVRARAAIADWRQAIGGIVRERGLLIEEAGDKHLAIPELPGWQAWRRDAGAVLDTARQLLENPLCGPRLDRSPDLRARIEGGLDGLERMTAADDRTAGLLRDWQAHVEAARSAGIDPSDAGGHDALIDRLGDMARHPDLHRAASVRLDGIVRNEERRRHERVRDRIAAQHERLLARAGNEAELLPYGFEYEEFRASVRAALETLDPESDPAADLTELDTQLDAAGERRQRLEALSGQALALGNRALALDEWAGAGPGRQLHGHREFPAWRRDADRFHDDWRAMLRDRAMAPHLDREPNLRAWLQRRDDMLGQEHYRAPGRETQQETAEQRRRNRDRSEGGGRHM